MRTIRGAAAILLVASAALGAGPESRLRAGAAAADVTPWLGLSINGGMHDRVAKHIHDPLHARCLVLDDGKTRLAIAVVDSCMIPREIIDEAKRIAGEATGIPRENMLVSATHTHEAPAAADVFQSEADPAYTKFLARRIADGIACAANNLEPAEIAIGVASLPGEVFNRRWRMKPGAIPPDPFGKTADQVKMNPPAGDAALVDPAGPTDPEIAFIALRSADGARPIALLANYSLHYVGGEGAGHVSADYFGVFAGRIAELLGAGRGDPPFVGIMSNGTSGNINNIDFRQLPKQRKPYEQIRHVGGAAAEAVAGALKSAEWRKEAPLAAAQEEIELGARLPSEEEVARAKEILAAAPKPLKTLDQIYARETALLAERPPTVKAIIQAMRIGDLAIAAIPCEVFVEIGLEIKAKSPHARTFTIELANGYNGYLPTEEHHALGGYETWRARSSYLEAGGDAKIKAAVFRLLDRVKP